MKILIGAILTWSRDQEIAIGHNQSKLDTYIIRHIH